MTQSNKSPADRMIRQKAEIVELFKSAEHLNAWEVSFLNNIHARLNRLIPLSEAQADKLQQIQKQVIERFD